MSSILIQVKENLLWKLNKYINATKARIYGVFKIRNYWDNINLKFSIIN